MTTLDSDPIDDALQMFLDARSRDVDAIADAASMAVAVRTRIRERAAGRTRLVRSVAALVAIGLLGALPFASGFAGGSRSPDPITDDPNTDPERILAPTSFGTFEWTRSESEVRIYPTAEIDGRVLGRDERGSWWALTDDLVWQETQAPEWVDADYARVGEETWAAVGSDDYGVSMGPTSYREVIDYEWYEGGTAPALYRKAGDEWLSVPLPTLEPSSPEGLRAYGPRFKDLVSTAPDSWILPAASFVEVPWDDVLGVKGRVPSGDSAGDVSSQLRAAWDQRSEELRIDGTQARQTRLKVTLVEGDPPAIEFRDAESDELVHTVPADLAGWSAEALLRAVHGWGFLDSWLVVGHEGTVSLVRPPWPPEDEWEGELVVAGGRYYALTMPRGDDYLAAGAELWRSPDGLDWERVGLPEPFSGPLDIAELAGGPAGLAIWLREVPPEEAESIWVSDDGDAWALADLGGPASYVTGTDFGWLLASAIVSADGRSWDPIEVPPLPGEPSLEYRYGYLTYGPEAVRDGYVTWFGRLTD